jgi:DNA (cytosine-5)-methyltransferase 1
VSRTPPLTVYEFFAGGGMARAGLSEAWTCLFANDFDPLKAAAYQANWGGEHFVQGDVWALTTERLPGRADLAWASSPCQDFSLAGGRAGLAGGRSSAFWGFWRLIEALNLEGRAPRAVVVENVVGLLTSHGGADFTALCCALADQGYGFGALEIDAAAFLPQSRPRVFILAVRQPPAPTLTDTAGALHSPAVRAAHARLPSALQSRWIWWAPPAPAPRNSDLAGLLEPDAAVRWRTDEQTRALLAQMSPAHRARVDSALAAGERRVGAVFRRMRIEHGVRVQRAEVRFDGLAGCLRTPRGGSSRQMLVVTERGQIRSRLIDGREGARLMGLPDDYVLPRSTTGALHVVGDGVAVPVVRFLSERLLQPLLDCPAQIAAE